MHFKDIIIEKIKENLKKYKYTILKIHKHKDTTVHNTSVLETIKIISHNIIKDINNLEYFNGLHLNKEINEDKLLLKYENEITEEDNKIKNSKNYKKIIKYLKKNNIRTKMINENGRIIIDHSKINNEEKNQC